MKDKTKKTIEIILVSAAMAVLVGWFFKDALFAGTIFAERDLSRYYYPLRQFAVSCIKSGTFPLWNPYVFCGNPLFAGLQEGVLYPLGIIYYLGSFARMFNAFVVFHFFAAGIFTYAFMRRMRASVYAAFLSAAVFALSGYMVSVVNLLTTLAAVTWFPLAVFLLYGILRPQAPLRKKYISAIFLGVVWLFMFLGGEPSIFYVTAGLFISGALYFTIERLVEKKELTPSYILPVITALIVFAGLSAVQLLPFVELLQVSGRKDMGLFVSSVWNMPVHDIVSIVVPFFHDIFRLFQNYWARQSWLDNYYVGILAIIFAAIAVMFEGSKKTKVIFALGLVGLGLSLGKALSIYPALYRFIPGFKYIRYTIRFYFILTFSICVLAGLGFDYCMKNIKNSSFRPKAFGMLLFSMAASIAYLFLYTHFHEISLFFKDIAASYALDRYLPPRHFYYTIKGPLFEKFINTSLINIRRACLFIMLTGLFIFFAALRKVRLRHLIFPWLVFLVIADVFMVNEGFNPQQPIDEFTRPTGNIEYLTKRYREGYENYPGDFNKSLFRVCASPQTSWEHSYVPEPGFLDSLEASKDRLISNRMVEFSIYDVSIYGSVYNKRNSRFLRLLMQAGSKNLVNLLDLLNVRFVASSKGPEAVKNFSLANETKPANLYENKDYLPRAFLVEDFKVIEGEDEIFEFMGSPEFNPREMVVLEEFPQPPTPNPQPPIAQEVHITTYEPNQVVIEASVSDTPKLLILTDTFYPGWHAYVNEEKARIYSAYFIFRAVYLSPGSHTIRFIYSPASFKIGLGITLATIAILLIFILTYYKTNTIIKP